MTRKFYLPLESTAICGHQTQLTLSGHYEAGYKISGRYGDYHGTYNGFGCKKCDDFIVEHFKKEVEELENWVPIELINEYLAEMELI